MKRSATVIVFLALSLCASAQKLGVSTNLCQWGFLGTANAELEYSVAQHFSVMAGGRYNPFSFTKKTGRDLYEHQVCGYAGFRYWPWYTYSGMWISAKAQYRSFEETGLWRHALEDATGVGAGLGFGYARMITRHLNLDLGLGVWAGRYLDYTLYRCSCCMVVRDSGPRMFAAIDDVKVGLSYIF
ncbi:MAG: DUF3575 domain-containing protein [Bacteroidales bacterium]|nr:DUF3575 domain-containing protein [Bacteroidales bacterium]